ncbi:uracil-DNA glycosylase [Listeria fleischmannii]|uniref:Uracil-DNA glycosylase n=1 Tax=Listeria fleischmannii TaxID=1069827 RepID=A0A841YFY1_9LIST|nr:uracil-DNA glycosylase [Listeria fleischmannii]EIA19153.1 uracil-DNA glycosylase [Listeria fleischmannii subsp. coloradonensis]MBC1399018.1 uracil-DNA glycosylase [Listeria fleischmannii]MBC1427271.1 uracil-DNA glycosylase [Listeria fleischmannii]STY34643.1 Uracil-DNA glycosylase [Listeria fleischmannii subsp. coloradonensis]
MNWTELIEEERQNSYFQELETFIHKAYEEKKVYPKKEEIYQAFELTPFEKVKVVLLGQDPYHGENQAHGLSFSVASSDAKFPPSLRNIFKELKTDLGIERTNRDLTDWAEQGVLLLNTVLTVDGDEKAGSHRKKGWETFTDHVINTLNMRDKPIVFVLWGNDAKKKIPLITNPKHKIITGVHPSPLSANGGFFGSKPFSQINEALVELGEDTIQW